MLLLLYRTLKAVRVYVLTLCIFKLRERLHKSLKIAFKKVLESTLRRKFKTILIITRRKIPFKRKKTFQIIIRTHHGSRS